MEGSLVNTPRPNDTQESNLKEWHLRARISRENTSSRRYSASYIRSFREDSRSFRSNFTISSTASSPGYHLKDEIDPSTYSFTTALKALQARSGYVWECLSPEGFALNSKWNEAERYICNPLSGEVPMECLSSKTLSGRSFRSHMASRVTMSAPLIYSVQPRRTNNSSKPISVTLDEEKLVKPQLIVHEEKQTRCSTRDVGTQSTPVEVSSSSPSPTSTPSIKERSIKRCEDTEDQDGDVLNSGSSVNSKTLSQCMQMEVKVTRDGEETKRKTKEVAQKKKRRKPRQLCYCTQMSGCSLLSSWRSLWMKKRQTYNNVQAPNK